MRERSEDKEFSMESACRVGTPCPRDLSGRRAGGYTVSALLSCVDPLSLYNSRRRSLSYSTTCGAALLILRLFAVIVTFPLKRRRS